MITFDKKGKWYQISFPEGFGFIEPCPACGKTAFTNGCFTRNKAQCSTCKQHYHRDQKMLKWHDSNGNKVVPQYPSIVDKIYKSLINYRLRVIFTQLSDQQYAFISPTKGYEHHIIVNQDLDWDQSIICIAHEVGHAIDWREQGLANAAEIYDSIRCNDVTESTVQIEQRAWFYAIDFLLDVGFEKWNTFYELYQWAIDSYVKEIQPNSYGYQLDMIKQLASKRLIELTNKQRMPIYADQSYSFSCGHNEAI